MVENVVAKLNYQPKKRSIVKRALHHFWGFPKEKSLLLTKSWTKDQGMEKLNTSFHGR